MRSLTRPGHRGRPQGPSSPFAGVSPDLCIEVPPERTDAAIHDWLEPHLVARDPGVSARNQLFVFLCGSFAKPSRQRFVTTLAARLGYHAINLSYPNSWTVGGLCQDSLESDCHGQVRLDILDGGERSGLVRVAPANCIEHRLGALLDYLANQAPGHGWESFLNAAGGLDWSRVVVAGHSQGGGQAAIIGKRYAVARILMLAAPVDRFRAPARQAPWLSTPGATAVDRYFGLVHSADPGVDAILRSWELLGLDQQPISRIDTSEPPYDGAQRLLTDTTQVPRGKYHGCLVQDRIMPLRLNGAPVFEPVWRYLLNAH